MIQEVLKTTGVTATAGIAENMYQCKVALDITAKHIPPDKDGVRIAELDMMTYRRTLWTHRDLTDFWMIGSATAKRLSKLGLYTMGDVARCSLTDENDSTVNSAKTPCISLIRRGAGSLWTFQASKHISPNPQV